jgi:hypothetical protein
VCKDGKCKEQVLTRMTGAESGQPAPNHIPNEVLQKMKKHAHAPRQAKAPTAPKIKKAEFAPKSNSDKLTGKSKSLT